MICPRSEAGSVTITTVLLFPFDRTRYFRVSASCPDFVVLMLTST
jgi:hypothetical protein